MTETGLINCENKENRLFYCFAFCSLSYCPARFERRRRHRLPNVPIEIRYVKFFQEHRAAALHECLRVKKKGRFFKDPTNAHKTELERILIN